MPIRPLTAALTSIVCGLWVFAAHAQPQMIILPAPPGTSSMMGTLSANGSAVVGTVYLQDATTRAFRWTQGEGLVLLDLLPGGSSSSAAGVSADGALCVGRGNSSMPDVEAFWCENGAVVEPWVRPTLFSSVTLNGMSANGSVLVGSGRLAASPFSEHAFRWTSAGGAQDLGTLPSRPKSEAFATNADGSCVAGWSSLINGSAGSAFRWTQETGMVDLGLAGLGGSRSLASGVSIDGNTIAGFYQVGANNRAFVWTVDQGATDIGTLPGQQTALAGLVSPDGQHVFGTSGPDAFVWTRQDGLIKVSDWLTARSVNMDGWRIERVSGVAVDSAAITGVGVRNGASAAFLITGLGVPCPADLDNDGDFANGLARDGAVTIEDLLSFLVGFEAGNVLVDLDNGTSTGTPDNAVDINDLLFFLARFEAGC